MNCPTCGGRDTVAYSGYRGVCVVCGYKTHPTRPGRRSRPVNPATCAHRHWTEGTLRHINGEARMVAHCRRCGVERQVEVEA